MKPIRCPAAPTRRQALALLTVPALAQAQTPAPAPKTLPLSRALPAELQPYRPFWLALVVA